MLSDCGDFLHRSGLHAGTSQCLSPPVAVLETRQRLGHTGKWGEAGIAFRDRLRYVSAQGSFSQPSWRGRPRAREMSEPARSWPALLARWPPCRESSQQSDKWLSANHRVRTIRYKSAGGSSERGRRSSGFTRMLGWALGEKFNGWASIRQSSVSVRYELVSYLFC